jgi:hypothetical protein
MNNESFTKIQKMDLSNVLNIKFDEKTPFVIQDFPELVNKELKYNNMTITIRWNKLEVKFGDKNVELDREKLKKMGKNWYQSPLSFFGGQKYLFAH